MIRSPPPDAFDWGDMTFRMVPFVAWAFPSVLPHQQRPVRVGPGPIVRPDRRGERARKSGSRWSRLGVFRPAEPNGEHIGCTERARSAPEPRPLLRASD